MSTIEPKRHPRVRNCKICNHVFDSNRQTRVYCSDKCRKEGKRLANLRSSIKRQVIRENRRTEKPCKGCGEPFAPKSGRVLYCSAECRGNAKAESSRRSYLRAKGKLTATQATKLAEHARKLGDDQEAVDQGELDLERYGDKMTDAEFDRELERVVREQARGHVTTWAAAAPADVSRMLEDARGEPEPDGLTDVEQAAFALFDRWAAARGIMPTKTALELLAIHADMEASTARALALNLRSIAKMGGGDHG